MIVRLAGLVATAISRRRRAVITLSDALDASVANRPRAVAYYDTFALSASPDPCRGTGTGGTCRRLRHPDANSTVFAGAIAPIVAGYHAGDVTNFSHPNEALRHTTITVYDDRGPAGARLEQAAAAAMVVDDHTVRYSFDGGATLILVDAVAEDVIA